MSRPLRPQEPNILFHVINRGNNRQQLFQSESDYEEFLELIRRYKKKFAVRIYHYALMPNHIHLLVEPSKKGSLSSFMQGLTLAHTYRFHKRHSSSGHAWQGRFKSTVIETDEYFLECGRYIELNPVRAQIVDCVSQYPWSSYRAHAFGLKDDLVNPHSFFEIFGATEAARQIAYRDFVNQG